MIRSSSASYCLRRHSQLGRPPSPGAKKGLANWWQESARSRRACKSPPRRAGFERQESPAYGWQESARGLANWWQESARGLRRTCKSPPRLAGSFERQESPANGWQESSGSRLSQGLKTAGKLLTQPSLSGWAVTRSSKVMPMSSNIKQEAFSSLRKGQLDTNAKQALEDAIDELKADPATGLMNLQAALAQAGKDQMKQESVKAKLPHIFELLPRAMDRLSGKKPKPLLTACSVIECCAKVCNDPSLGGAQVVIAGEAIRQCQSRLVTLLKKSQIPNHNWRHKVTKGVALATMALLMLEDHTTECKQELVESGGIAVALQALQVKNGGVPMKTKESLALMLSIFADTPESAAVVIANGGTFALIPYVEEPETYSVSKAMHSYCITVLEACLAHDRTVKNKDQIQAAIDQGALKLACLTSSTSLHNQNSSANNPDCMLRSVTIE